MCACFVLKRVLNAQTEKIFQDILIQVIQSDLFYPLFRGHRAAFEFGSRELTILKKVTKTKTQNCQDLTSEIIGCFTSQVANIFEFLEDLHLKDKCCVCVRVLYSLYMDI